VGDIAPRARLTQLRDAAPTTAARDGSGEGLCEDAGVGDALPGTGEEVALVGDVAGEDAVGEAPATPGTSAGRGEFVGTGSAQPARTPGTRTAAAST
jgi:hypothetical protein